MPKLKLPRALPGPAEPPAPEPPSPPALLLGRREFLKGLGALLAALAAAVTGVRRVYAAARGRFFTGHEFGPLTGLRTIYRQSLRRVDQTARAIHGKPFVRLEPAEQDAVFALLDSGPASVRFAPDPRRGVTFIDLLVEHTLEGCFAAPEYGGNRRLGGWRMLGIEGDDQPLGYSIFSRAKGDYVERPDHPMSTPNPDEVAAPRPITPDAEKVQDTIIALTGIFAPD